MKIGMYVGQLGLRGTDQFVYKLAEVCEKDLGHAVTLVTPAEQRFSKDVTKDMVRSNFFVVFKSPHESLDDIAQRYGLDVVLGALTERSTET